MQRFLLVVLVALTCPVASAAQAAESERAVRDVLQRVQDALNARDWARFGAQFSRSGDAIFFDSPRAVGPRAVQALIGDGWAATPADVRATFAVGPVRFVTPGVAIAHVEAEFTGTGASSDRAIFVVVNQSGGWRIEALRVFPAEGV